MAVADGVRGVDQSKGILPQRNEIALRGAEGGRNTIWPFLNLPSEPGRVRSVAEGGNVQMWGGRDDKSFRLLGDNCRVKPTFKSLKSQTPLLGSRYTHGYRRRSSRKMPLQRYRYPILPRATSQLLASNTRSGRVSQAYFRDSNNATSTPRAPW